MGALTWSAGVLRLRPGQGSSAVDWISPGPALRRFEFQEEELCDGRLVDLQELFEVARLKGADVVLLPELGPRSEWRAARFHRRWH